MTENFWNFYILILVISYPSRLKISCFKETKLSGGRLTLVAKRIHIKSLQHSSAKQKWSQNLHSVSISFGGKFAHVSRLIYLNAKIAEYV